tara:strand:+ start:187 stop:543 length:357 start_codon:yes stop_codon:yes gene_type:complete
VNSLRALRAIEYRLAIETLKSICYFKCTLHAGKFPDSTLRQSIVNSFKRETRIKVFDITTPSDIDSGYFQFTFNPKCFSGKRQLLLEKYIVGNYVAVKYHYATIMSDKIKEIYDEDAQ